MSEDTMTLEERLQAIAAGVQAASQQQDDDDASVLAREIAMLSSISDPQDNLNCEGCQ